MRQGSEAQSEEAIGGKNRTDRGANQIRHMQRRGAADLRFGQTDHYPGGKGAERHRAPTEKPIDELTRPSSSSGMSLCL